MSYFWSWPPFSPVKFENNVSQARDMLAGERNFLIGTRTSFFIAVSASSVVFKGGNMWHRGWIDWTLTGVLLLMSLVFPISSLINYSEQFDGYMREIARVHTSTWFLVFVLMVAVCDVLIAIRALVEGSQASSWVISYV